MLMIKFRIFSITQVEYFRILYWRCLLRKINLILMMLLYCLCDSYRVIWIAFHWQDLQMFESSVSSLIQFWTFHGFSYFCITKRSFWSRKSKKAIWMQTSSLHLSALHIQPERSWYNRPSKWDDYLIPFIAANWKCEAQCGELGREATSCDAAS